MKFKTIGPASAELLAIKEGLLIAWGRKITNLELEIDAEILKKMLEKPEDYHDHQLGAILVDVSALLKREWSVTILHVKRDINGVAHELADIGRTMDGERTYHFQPPKKVLQTYFQEIPSPGET